MTDPEPEEEQLPEDSPAKGVIDDESEEIPEPSEPA